MRVLAMTNLYPNPAQPRRAPFNRHQLRLLQEHCPVRVIAPIAWTERRRFASPVPARVTLDGIAVDHPTYWFPPKLLRGCYGYCFQWSIRKAFHHAVQEFQPTILFAPWAYPDGWAAVRLAKHYQLPAVVQVHGSDVKLLKDYPAKAKRTAEALANAKAVIAVSEDLANDVRAMGAKCVEVIYDGIDPAIFHPGERAANIKKRVLYAGNLVAVKSVATLIEVMTGIDAELIIAGDGPLKDSLSAMARQRGVQATFLGSVAQEKLAEQYRRADLFVLPSISEGVPNVLLEASACGVPWVATRVGGIPEIADLGRSRLVPPGDATALRAAIAEMLAAPPPAARAKPRLRTEAVQELFEFLKEQQ